MQKHIAPSEYKECPCGTSYKVYNLIDFDENGDAYIVKQTKV